MDLNFPVFGMGVHIYRASNDVGSLFVGPGHGSTRILEKNKITENGSVLINFLLLSNFPDF